MEASAETRKTAEVRQLSVEDRSLQEFWQLVKHRQENGQYDQSVIRDVFPNFKTAVMEGGIPHAVSEVVQHYEKQDGINRPVLKWLGKTAVQVAASGYVFHVHQAAHQRVDVEVDEAEHAERDQKPGFAKIFISPEMSRKDASLDVARREHLADDDQIRVSWLRMGEDGQPAERVLKTLLVKDIPLEAWVKMLADEGNMFGKAIEVEDPESALSVMKVHRELEVPEEELKDGPIGVLKAVAPYIDDPLAKQSVLSQIAKFEEADQKGLDVIAEEKAREWLDFELALVESYYEGYAQPEIVNFIHRLQNQWSADQLKIINSSWRGDADQFDDEAGAYIFSEKLAIVLEDAFRNTLWSRAGVLAGSQEVIEQLSPENVIQIKQNEQKMSEAVYGSAKWQALQAANNQFIAQEQVIVGRGCNGMNNAFSETNDLAKQLRKSLGLEGSDEVEDEKWKPGVCRVKYCPSPSPTEVGACSVCRCCQSIYDSGDDPVKVYARNTRQEEQAAVKPTGLLGVLAS